MLSQETNSLSPVTMRRKLQRDFRPCWCEKMGSLNPSASSSAVNVLACVNGDRMGLGPALVHLHGSIRYFTCHIEQVLVSLRGSQVVRDILVL
jgi:hypothetical protein